MRHHDDGLAVALVQLLEQRHDFARGPAVEVAGRLVGEQQVRLVGERARDRDALLLAARQFARTVLLAPAEAHRVRAAGWPAPSRSAAGTPANIIDSATFSAAVIVETRLNDWKMMPTFFCRCRLSSVARHLRQVLVEDAAACPSDGAVEPGDQVQQRGLAGSRGAEQADELPLFDLQRHAVEGAHRGGAHLVVLLEIPGFENRGHGTLQYKAMAALIEAIEIKRKMFFEYEGAPYHTIDVEVSRPTARGGQTLVRIKMRNMITKAVFDKTFKAGDKFAEPDLELIDATFQYADSAGFHFMDQETFDTVTLQADVVGDDRLLLVDNVLVQVQKFNGGPIGLQFPPHIELTVTSTEPGVRGDTASGGVTKAATLETGLEIRVPLFIKEGEKVKVHTETREFAGRA